MNPVQHKKNLIVTKFGGTSMGSKEAMLNAAKIMLAKPQVRVGVVSATSGTTNQLLKITHLKQTSPESSFQQELELLKERHRKLAIKLSSPETILKSLELLFAELESHLMLLKNHSEKEIDAILAIGERCSSLIFTQALTLQGAGAVVWVDARKYLKTDSFFGKAEPDRNQSFEACAEWRAKLKQTSEIYVTQGFIGSDPLGNTTTLGRGGSDYSAALFAEALEAHELEIWTDVPGVLTMDPRVVPTARIISEISFSEAAEMANFGAKVLHPATLWPAIRAAIPVYVGSTFQPEKGGTRILPDHLPQPPLIRAIAVRKQQTLITVSSLRMLNTHGFLAKMFEVLARHHLSIDLVTTSEVSVALTVDETALGSSGKKVSEQKEMLAELKSFSDIKIEENLSLIAIIGNGLNHSPGVAAKVFQSISEFNLRLICHGASEHNICFLVDSNEANEVAKRLHHVCIEWSSK